MEKYSDKQTYKTRYTQNIVDVFTKLQDENESPGRFHNENEKNITNSKLFHKTLSVLQDLIGPLFQIQKSAIPRRYEKILNYLVAKGYAHSIYQEKFFNDEPRLFDYYLHSPHNEDFTDANKLKYDSYTHGMSRDENIAISKTFGEFFERYTLHTYRETDLHKASTIELIKRHVPFVHPSVFNQFTDEQKKRFVPVFNEKSPLYWSWGKNLITNKKTLLPSQLIFFGYSLNHKNFIEPTLRALNTNGAAAHFTLEEALLSGIYEIIQRDGFLIYWLNHAAPPIITNESIINSSNCPTTFKELLIETLNYGFEVYFLDTTTPDIGIPSCICTIIDKQTDVRVSIAGGCELDWFKTLERSLEEAILVFHLSRKRVDLGKNTIKLDENYVPFSDENISNLERIDLFANPKMFSHFEFFISGNKKSIESYLDKKIVFENKKQELEYVKRIFSSLGTGYEIYYYEVQHELLKRFKFHTVKVIIPELVQLYLTESLASLGAKRLKSVAKNLGFESPKKFNPWPHPFP